MRIQDLIKISLLNLKRRKLRTFFTLLGVVIGTASIILMMSLGMAAKASMKKMIEESGGATEINIYGVTQKDGGRSQGVVTNTMSNTVSTDEKQLDDKTVNELRQLPNVKIVAPTINIGVSMRQGAYKQPYAQLKGISKEGLKAKKIDIKEGRYPESSGMVLELFFGSSSIIDFNKGSFGMSEYWNTGVLPKIKTVDGSFIMEWEMSMPTTSGSIQEEGSSKPPVKKTMAKGVGLMEGKPDNFTSNSNSIYTDIDSLKSVLKKIYGKNPIPGQPLNKAGKPFKEWVYSEINVYATDIKHVEELQATIRSMGFEAQSNLEMSKMMEESMKAMQMLLGGIGSISLFVATIGIVNTMMMSTYERNREIGVYKVLGCDLKDILLLFLLEASMIGFFGGIFGLGLSGIISIIGNQFGTSLSLSGIAGSKLSIITPALACMGVLFSTGMGTLAGYFPAKRATKLSALAAIKNE